MEGAATSEGATASTALPDQIDFNDPDTWIGLDFVFDQILAQLDAQERRWQDMDGRLRLVLGLIGVVFAAAGVFARGTGSASLLPFRVGLVAGIAVGLYLVAGAAVVWAYHAKAFDRPPNPSDLRDYMTTDTREAKREVLDTIVLAYTENERIIAMKQKWSRLAYGVTAVATAALGMALIMQIAVQTSPFGP